MTLFPASTRSEGIGLAESVTGGQELLGAPLGGLVAAAGRRLFFPSCLSDPAALQEGIGHHRHQRVAMKPGPGPTLKVVQAKLFLELLMGLLSHRPAPMK